METREVDVAIVGAGTAGMTAYQAALAHTNRVVVIESGAYGTTCARVGCMPSKLLIAAAEVAQQVKRAGNFGIDVAASRIDGRRVMQRVRMERDRFVGFVVDAVTEWPAEHKLSGQARFISQHELQVGEHVRVRAGRIVIATGSRPAVPEPWRVLGDRLLVNDDVFQWDDLPGSLIVVGTGVVGLELSQALARLGVKVCLLGRGSRFGPLTDPVVNQLAGTLAGTGLDLHADANIEQVDRRGDSVIVSFTENGALRQVSAEYLLAATGRRPNLDALELSVAGIAVDERGVPAFDDTTGRIGDTSVFIAGDVSTAHPLLHEAADDGHIAGDNAGRYPEIRAHPRRTPLTILFTEPQIMLTGKTFRELTRCGCQFAIGQVRFEEQGRSRVIGRNQGLLRVYGEQGSGLFLGAEMIGPAAEHLGHLLAWSAQQRLTVQQMLDGPFYHPVIEEGLRTALRRLRRELHMGPVPVKHCLDCGPGA